MLQENYSAGRLTFDELQSRLESAYAGKTMGDLTALVADLPVPRPPRPPSPALGLQAARVRRVRDRFLTYVLVMLFLVALWAASGRHGFFWPIWPMGIGGFILALDVIGLGRSSNPQRHRSIERSHRRTRHHLPPRDE